jgi:hypothetical protein
MKILCIKTFNYSESIDNNENFYDDIIFNDDLQENS